MTSASTRDPSNRRLLLLTAVLFLSYLCIAMPLPIVPVFVTAQLGYSNVWAGLGVGVAFVAIAKIDGCGIAMIHAIEVAPEHRRKGGGGLLIRGAASFAAEQDAAWLALAVTEANAPARALYERLGIARAGSYHYRVASG